MALKQLVFKNKNSKNIGAIVHVRLPDTWPFNMYPKKIFFIKKYYKPLIFE